MRDNLAKDPDFIENRKHDLCASLQYTIVTILIEKLEAAACKLGVKEIALAGGVAANSGLRKATVELGNRYGLRTYIPEFKFTTDNAAMIAIAGYYKYKKNEFAEHSIIPQARLPF